ncbi:hypothetical protein BGZ54_008503 [Gamsiella multidivaricata]|nr:hypothetical protein BGZ54_008503 [Gamsiella multidivaricata]
MNDSAFPPRHNSPTGAFQDMFIVGPAHSTELCHPIANSASSAPESCSAPVWSSSSDSDDNTNITTPSPTATDEPSFINDPAQEASTTTTLIISPPIKVSTYTIRLDITSDTTCPWCFVTKRRISRAIETFHTLSPETRKVRFDIHWHPYQLDPQAPKVPTQKSKLYNRKFGPDRALFMRARVVNAAKNEGITFVQAEQAQYCSTLDSHRLIKYARKTMGRKLFATVIHSDPSQQGSNTEQSEDQSTTKLEDDIDEFGNKIEDTMVEELFRSHFERGECGDLPTLKECARNVLLEIAAAEEKSGHGPVDRDEIEKELAEIERFLATDEGLQEIKDEIRVAKHDMGMQGVPTIVVQNMYLLSGGQDSSTFVEIFKRVV